eukprot:m.86395 g.86395  ORF g.86395 m.86395 type:complete len:485 (-) comp14875_c0_seq2:1754-3208(-)
MPELPAVERVRALFEKHIQGHRIVSVTAVEDPLVFAGLTKDQVEAHLLNHTVIGSHRRGKQLWFELDSGMFMTMHLGMTGSVDQRGAKAFVYGTDTPSAKTAAAVGALAAGQRKLDIDGVLQAPPSHQEVPTSRASRTRTKRRRVATETCTETRGIKSEPVAAGAAEADAPVSQSKQGKQGRRATAKTKGETAARLDDKQAPSWPPRHAKVCFVLDNGNEFYFRDQRRFGRLTFTNDIKSHPSVAPLGRDPINDWFGLDEFCEMLSGTQRPIKAVLLDQHVMAGVGNWIADDALYMSAVHPARLAPALTRQQAAALHHAIPHICNIAVGLGAETDEMPKGWLIHVRWKSRNKTTQTLDGKTVTFSTVAGRTTAVVAAVQTKGPSIPSKKNKKKPTGLAKASSSRTATARKGSKTGAAAGSKAKAAQPNDKAAVVQRRGTKRKPPAPADDQRETTGRSRTPRQTPHKAGLAPVRASKRKAAAASR